MSMIMDTHAHLYDIADVDEVLEKASKARVSDIVMMGVDQPSNEAHLKLLGKSQLPRLHLALGLHPGNITSQDETRSCFAFMREHMDKTVAVGETGLDFWYKWVRKDQEKKAEQKAVFEEHLKLAHEFDRPVVIHSRGAWKYCLDMTLAAGITKANFHWYSGPIDVLQRILDAGFVVSFTPSLSHSVELKKAAEYAPLDSILIETDCPVPFTFDEGRRESVPQDVWQTLKLLAEIKGVNQDRLLEQVDQNGRDFFGL